MLVSDTGCCAQKMMKHSKKKTGCAHPDAPCQKQQTIAICTTGSSPVGNALFFFAGGMMSLFRLPYSKFSLPFLAVPAGKDGWVECPCQTVDDFIGIRGSICGLFLFVQTHAPLDIGKQHTMCLLLCCLVFNICECGFQRSNDIVNIRRSLFRHTDSSVTSAHLPRHTSPLRRAFCPTTQWKRPVAQDDCNPFLKLLFFCQSPYTNGTTYQKEKISWQTRFPEDSSCTPHPLVRWGLLWQGLWWAAPVPPAVPALLLPAVLTLPAVILPPPRASAQTLPSP